MSAVTQGTVKSSRTTCLVVLDSSTMPGLSMVAVVFFWEFKLLPKVYLKLSVLLPKGLLVWLVYVVVWLRSVLKNAMDIFDCFCCLLSIIP